jgi:hypothetical protein
MLNHPFVRHIARATGVGWSALAMVVAFTAAMPTVSASAGRPAGPKPPALSLVSVKVYDEGTIDTGFSNPMDPAKLTYEQFQAPHYYWVIPHTHIAVAYKLLDGNRTVRTVLDRGLHPITGRCLGSANTDDPRCSTDTLNWEVVGATDMYGQQITNKDWKVWAKGAKKHPDPCAPGCP